MRIRLILMGVLVATTVACAAGVASISENRGDASPASPGSEASASVKPSSPLPPEPHPAPGFLEAYAATDRFRLGEPKSIAVTPDGDAILFLRSGPRDFVQSLYSVDPATGIETKLLDASSVLGGREETLTKEEIALRERLRLAAKGIASFSLAPDGGTVLVPLAGRLHLLDRASDDVRTLPETGGTPFDPQWSPDGSRIAFVQDDEVHVLDVATGSATPLTSGAGGPIVHGISEFVAQEEMSRHHGFWWSPDSRTILYQETDHSGMETMHILDPTKPESEPDAFPYPRPGKKNASVRLGLIPVAGGETTWVEWDRDAFEYLATVKWPAAGPLTIVVQNRKQTIERVLAVDPSTGATRVLHEETDDAWIDLDQKFPYWWGDGSGYLWRTERDGEPRLEWRDASGRFVRWITPRGFGLREFVAADEDYGELLLVASTDPRAAHLWRVPVEPANGPPLRMTEGDAMHDAVAGPDGSARVVSRATPDALSEWRLWERGRPTDRTLTVLREDPGFRPVLAYDTVGARDFRAVEIRPRDFDASRRHPVIVHVYGGPTSTMVRLSASRYLLGQWIADHGYVVVAFDGRGTPYRGSAWQREVKDDLIEKPLADQVAALQAWAAERPYVDLERVGMYGWSFGGYFSAMAVMRHPEVFRVGVAGAPVVRWEDYDTHYTERYMDLPQDNPDGYSAGNVLTYAKDLERPLLLIHGTADDNVYFMHSLKLVDALFREGKSFEFLPLAGSTHRVKDPEVVQRMYDRTMDHFDRYLKP